LFLLFRAQKKENAKFSSLVTYKFQPAAKASISHLLQ